MCRNDESPGNVPTRLQQYDMAYAQITHENDLIGHRITWFLTFQGFLFTAVFVAVGFLFHKDYNVPGKAADSLAAAIAVLMLLAIVSCLVCFGLIVAANAHIDEVEDWWKRCLAHKEPGAFPPIRGGHARPQRSRWAAIKRTVNPGLFVLAIAAAWIAFGYLLLKGGDASPRTSVAQARGPDTGNEAPLKPAEAMELKKTAAQ